MTDNPRGMERSTYIFRHDGQNDELICHREMFPNSLNSSQPSGTVVNGGDKTL